MAENEATLERIFYVGCRRRGWLVEKLAPTSPGIPDRLVIMPGGRVVFVELKTETGRVRPLQKVWHDKARGLGAEVVVLYGRADVEAFVRGL